MRRSVLLFLSSLVLAAVSFGLGLNWGLPNRDADPFLFGDRRAWTGAEIMQFAGPRATSTGLGADVDRNPLGVSAGPVLLNETDQQRAEIVRRYRLYSAQPDEMITFMSLAQMKPRQGHLDPKLYQYGGLWVYPVGALLAAAGKLGLIQLTADPTFYLDHPEAFARFYIVARAYSAAFGIIGAACVWWLVRRLGTGPIAGALAMIAFAMLPVVNNMAHEAKPHLPAAVLMLMAMMAAIKYVEAGFRRWWIVAAVLCGAATGMILSAAPVCIILPLMVLFRAMPWRSRFIIISAAALVAVDVYAITNPYVVKHLVGWTLSENPLRSNLANSNAMYSPALSAQSVFDARRLLSYAATGPIVIAGIVCGVALLLPRRTTASAEGAAERAGSPLATHPDFPNVPATRPVAALLLAPSAVILMQFVLLAEGKPGEYARFALLPSLAFLILAFGGIASFLRQSVGSTVVLAVITGATTLHGVTYVWRFLSDASDRPSRLIVAERLESIRRSGATSLGVRAEPAPYSLPPVNLWEWKIWYAPSRPELDALCDMRLEAEEADGVTAAHSAPTTQAVVIERHPRKARRFDTPISWAAKPWVLTKRRSSPGAGEPASQPDE